MVAKVNSSSGSWSCLVVHNLNPRVTVNAIGYILSKSEVFSSFDIEKTYKIKIKDLLIKYDLSVRCALFTESFLPPSTVLRWNEVAER